uniref:Uncharacterized protein n=1 Tax=Cyprinus carpio carpio TaxID=630221 RepID=A0A9J8AGK8_CYPCA
FRMLMFVSLFLVSRFHCESESFKMDLILDVCGFDMFDGRDDGEYTPQDDRPSRAGQFDYVMYGKVYRIEADETSTEAATPLRVSFFHFCHYLVFS